MRCVVSLGILFASAFSSAVSLVLDPGQTIVRPDLGTASFVISGTVNYGGVPSATLSGVSLGAFSAFGSGKSFTASDASATGNILGHFSTGIYTGPQIRVTIDSTTPYGTYTGTGQLSLRFGTAPAILTTTSPLSFTVMAAPVASTPEPATWAALGLGVAAVVRRRRSS